MFLAGSGTHSSSYLLGNGGSFPLGKHLGSEADGLPPSSAEVKMSGALFLSFCIYSEMLRDIFTFLIYKRQIHAGCKFKNYYL
jgi:hypothetical protein